MRCASTNSPLSHSTTVTDNIFLQHHRKMVSLLTWLDLLSDIKVCLFTNSEGPNLSAGKMVLSHQRSIQQVCCPNNWLIRYTHPLSLRMQEDRSGIPGAARIRISQHSIGIWRRGGCFWRPHKCNKSFSRRITSEIKKSFSISIRLNFMGG